MTDNNNNGGRGRVLGTVVSVLFALVLTFIVFITIKSV